MRKSAVADRFYPASPKKLTDIIHNFTPQPPPANRHKAFAVISPHAGYVYSGALAAKTFHQIKVPETVVLLGPNHTGQGQSVALSSENWDMALGEVAINRPFNALLQDASTLFHLDELAHKFEHSIEVQIPFLQVQQDKLQIVPIILSRISYTQCEELASALAHTIQGYKGDVLIVASSDMNHFESRKISEQKDGLALEKIKHLEPKGLYNTVVTNNISMCGMIPVVITLLAVKILGAKRSQLIDYTDSGYISGDTSQVVGYAGIVIY